MRRALTVSVVALALALAATGCSSVSSADVAASVNGVELSQEDFESLLVDTSVDQADAPATTSVDGNTARARLTNWTVLRILQDDLATTGTEVTDAQRDDAAAQLEASDPNWSTAPPALQELLIELQATITAWTGALEPTDEASVQAAYEEGIAASGVACVSHILVETEEEALAILGELEGGGDFATLAAENTTDPGSAPSGGALQCTTAGEFEQTYTPPFVEAALGADVGVPVGPVQTQFGYHLVQVRPYDDVSGDVVLIYDDASSRFRRLAVAADVEVDPRYGAFDSNQGIVALG